MVGKCRGSGGKRHNVIVRAALVGDNEAWLLLDVWRRDQMNYM